MIKEAIDTISSEILSYLISIGRVDISNSAVIEVLPPSDPENQSGKHAEKLRLSLINIQEERVLKSQTNHIFRQNDRISHVNPELRLTLFILIVADFSTYTDGLIYLSDVIGFFQSKNVFTGQTTPSLDSSIEKMIVDLYSLNFETQNHLWGVLGARYMPSVVYKVQTLIIQENLRKDDQEPILNINLNNCQI